MPNLRLYCTHQRVRLSTGGYRKGLHVLLTFKEVGSETSLALRLPAPLQPATRVLNVLCKYEKEEMLY